MSCHSLFVDRGKCELSELSSSRTKGAMRSCLSLSLSLAFSLFLLSSQVARSVCDLYSVLMKQSPEADCVQVVREGKREEERSSEGKTS